MSQPTTDRDLLIRVDADLKNLATKVKEVSTLQIEQGHQSQQLSSSLQTLTYNVGALVEGMKEAKAGLDVQNRIAKDVEELKEWRSSFKDTFHESIDEIKNIMTEDRKKWEPWVSLASHWKWLLAGVATVTAFVGWPTIKLFLAAVSQI